MRDPRLDVSYDSPALLTENAAVLKRQMLIMAVARKRVAQWQRSLSPFRYFEDLIPASLGTVRR
jgi:hypothetical protein